MPKNADKLKKFSNQNWPLHMSRRDFMKITNQEDFPVFTDTLSYKKRRKVPYLNYMVWNKENNFAFMSKLFKSFHDPKLILKFKYRIEGHAELKDGGVKHDQFVDIYGGQHFIKNDVHFDKWFYLGRMDFQIDKVQVIHRNGISFNKRQIRLIKRYLKHDGGASEGTYYLHA